MFPHERLTSWEALEYDLTVMRSARKYRNMHLELALASLPQGDSGIGAALTILQRMYVER